MNIELSDVAAPGAAVVQRMAAGRPVRAMWRNELGDVTFRVASGTEFIKVGGRYSVDFTDEARRLTWARRYLPVPEVLDFGTNDDTRR